MKTFTNALRTAKLRPKVTALLVLTVSLAIYLLGFKLLFVPVALIAMTIFLPMPKVFDSWLSRLVMAVLFLYALLQIAGLIQYFSYMRGHFPLLASITTLLIGGLIWLYGSDRMYRPKLVSLKDLGAVLGCSFFILPFAPILTGHNSLGRITKMASTQIVDATVHHDGVIGIGVIQNLYYQKSNYYPRGFHLATGFMLDGAIGHTTNMTWSQNVVLYFMFYILFGLLLCFVLIYAGYSFLGLFGELDAVGLFSVALTVGIVSTGLYLLVFVQEGFLNYYYICAAIIASFTYLLDDRFKGFKALANKNFRLSWPPVAFLLVSSGAVNSWPLFVVPVLLATVLWLMPHGKEFKTVPKLFLNIANLPLLAAAFVHVAAFLIQVYYMGNSGDKLNANGALHSFNLLLLIIETILLVVLLATAKISDVLRRRLVILTIPYVVMITVLMGWQYFLFGEARYYLIKSAMVLEMLLLVLLCAWVVQSLKQSRLDGLSRLLIGPFIIMLVVFGSLGTQAAPLREVRDLFRDVSGVGKPPFLDNDTQQAAALGSQGKISHFNTTALHYDVAGQRLFAHAQTVQWANAMANKVSGEHADCFGRQFSLLAYGKVDPGQQKLIQAVKDCAAESHKRGLDYFVITDKPSVPYLQAIFGDSVRLVD